MDKARHSAPDFSHESMHSGVVAGMDEAGRGPWAGPVVASCVVLERGSFSGIINDSKKLTRGKRDAAFDMIMHRGRVGVGIASVEEIDTLNILGATKLAMQRAFAELDGIDVVLVDGNQPPKLPCQTVPLIKGDGKSLSIAAASIIAKVTRDRMMEEYEREYPGYHFGKHAGYGTPAHQKALSELGVCAIHRRSFAPIAALLAKVA